MWQPLNLTEICPVDTNLDACSPFGYIFLNLLVKLFGDSIDRRIQQSRNLNIEEYARESEYTRDIPRHWRNDFIIEDNTKNHEDRTEEIVKDTEHNRKRQEYRNNKFHVVGTEMNGDIIHNLEANRGDRIKDAKELDLEDARIQNYRNSNFKPDYIPNSEQNHRHLNAYETVNKDVRYRERIETDERVEVEEYDFIVVGAGAAGCIVANRLTEVEEWKVLLLEAGPEEPEITNIPSLYNALQGSNVDWGYVTQGNGKSCLAREGGRCAWPRGKMMGGSSSINSLLYIRGNRVDYDEWAAKGNEGWSYEEVLPYFKKSENNLDITKLNPKYHGTDGEIPISFYPVIQKPTLIPVDAFIELGFRFNDANGRIQSGTGILQANNINGVRVSTNSAFIRPIRYTRKNIAVKTKSEVIKILINDKRMAYGVKYVKNGKVYKAIARKEVIISAGAVNSPQLLMLSGIGPKNHLNDLNIKLVKDLAVGENLHDHVNYEGIVVALSNKTSTTVSNDEIVREITDYKYNEHYYGPLLTLGPLNTRAIWKTDPKLPAPDVVCYFNGIDWMDYLKDPVNFSRLRIFPTVFYNGFNVRTTHLFPLSRGKLILNSTNPYGPPLLDPNYFGVESDLDDLMKAVKVILSLEETEAFKSNGLYFVRQPMPACKQYQWGTYDYFKCLAVHYTASPYHPVGSCKMGPQWDENAVVDPRLRVYGVKRLRVVDASIMPAVPRANTHAPSMMVGEKGADMIKEDWLR